MNYTKPSTWRRIAATGCAVAALTALVGCGGQSPEGNATSTSTVSPQELVDSAKAEGSIVAYTAFPDAVQQELNKAFTEKYSIEVKSQRLIASEFDQRVQSELQAGQHVSDVVIGSNEAAFDSWKENDWLAPLPLSAMESDDAWPEKYRTDHTASVQTNFYGVLYNTAQVPAASVPKTWDDLLKPEFKGKVLLLDPKNGTASQFQYNLLLEDKGEDFLSKLKGQASLINSGVPGSQNVGAGAALIYAPVVPPVVSQAKAAGLSVEAVYPSPVASANVTAATLSGAPHPNAAALFLDFVMSADGQAIINKGGYSALPGVTGTQPLPADLQPSNNAQTVENADKIIKLLAG